MYSRKCHLYIAYVIEYLFHNLTHVLTIHFIRGYFIQIMVHFRWSVLKGTETSQEAVFLATMKLSNYRSRPDRLKYLEDMYEYFLSWVDFHEFPPKTQYIQRMPISAFEDILQNITVRFLLYGLTPDQCYNARAISMPFVCSCITKLNGPLNSP